MFEAKQWVSWESQGRGGWKKKVGKVVAFVPANENADEYLPADVKPSHIKYDCSVSQYDRVLVAVQAGKFGQIFYYYCPKKSALTVLKI